MWYLLMEYLNKHHPKLADAIYASGLWIVLIFGIALIACSSFVLGDIRIFLGLGSVFLMGWGVFYLLRS